MINFYYWYAIITSGTLILYMLPLSDLNKPLDPTLFGLIISSILISIILGYKNKKMFIIKEKQSDYKWNYKPIIIITSLTIIDFLMLGNIPFFGVLFDKNFIYTKNATPMLHVLVIMLYFYYFNIFTYRFFFSNKYKKKNLMMIIYIVFLSVLYNTRSFFVMAAFVIINLWLYKKKNSIKRKNKILIILGTIVVVSLIALLFGMYGNKRSGYNYTDSKFIERIAKIKNWPSFIPKEYIWAYAYITSPLANLNYNIMINNTEMSFPGFIDQIVSKSISKRLIDEDKIVKSILIDPHFTVSTGYIGSYNNMGIPGMVVYWIIIFIFPILLYKYIKKKEYVNEYYYCYLLMYCICIVFNFFDNMFSFGGTTPCLYMSFILLILSLRKQSKYIGNERNE